MELKARKYGYQKSRDQGINFKGIVRFRWTFLMYLLVANSEEEFLSIWPESCEYLSRY